jgi:peptidyl-prolyl cis-trans isomerase A (cyclophilin A)
MLRRQVLVGVALAAALTAGSAAAQPTPPATGTVRVDLQTSEGLIVLDLYADKAPITAGNFLKYVKGKRYDGVTIYRAVRTKGAEETGFIQGGAQNDPKRVLPNIPHESTTQTGLTHKDGTITMARGKPGSANSDFVIMVGDAAYMDANPSAPGDNLGYAAFGQVVDGMDVVKKILALPTNGHPRNPVMQGQILDPPVGIISVRVEK